MPQAYHSHYGAAVFPSCRLKLNIGLAPWYAESYGSLPPQVYLYIAASKVVGCLMVESISQAYRTVLLPPPSSPLREAEQREPLLEVAPAADVSKGDAFVSMGRVFPGRGATLGGAQGVLGSVREGSVSGFDGGRFVETGGVQNGLEREEGVCAFVNNGTAAKEGEGTARGLGSAADEGLREEGTEPLEERAAEGSVGERTRESSAGVPETGSPRRSGVNALFDVTNREVPGSIRSGECAGAGTGRTLRSRTALAKGKIEERTNRGEEGAAREGALIRRNEQLVAFGQPTGTGGTVQHAVESNPIDSFSVGGEHLEFGADGCGRQPGPETKSQERQDTGPSCGQPTVVPSVAVTQQEFPYVDAIQPSHQSPSETPQPSEPLGQRERLQTPSGTPPPLSFGQLDRSQEASEGPKALQGRPSLYAQMMSASGRKRVKSEKRTAETEKLTSAGEPQALMCRTEAVRATCGVRAIWVRKAERRKGVASALMDAMRCSILIFFPYISDSDSVRFGMFLWGFLNTCDSLSEAFAVGVDAGSRSSKSSQLTAQVSIVTAGTKSA